jgi:hypothetical protein
LFLPIIAYTLSSTELEIRAKQFLLEARGWGKREERGGGKGGVMTQSLYAYTNKGNFKKREKCTSRPVQGTSL